MRFPLAEIMFAVCLMQMGCQQERSTADADVPSSTLLAPHAISAPDPQAKTKDPPVRSWPLDRLDRNQLTAIEREELFPEVVAVLRGKSGTILDCAFSPDGTRLATGNQEGALGLWDLTGPAPKEMALLKADEGGPVKRVAFSLDSKHLVSLNGGKVAQLWEVSSDGTPSVAIMRLPVAR